VNITVKEKIKLLVDLAISVEQAESQCFPQISFDQVQDQLII
jgi:hypothetical protein